MCPPLTAATEAHADESYPQDLRQRGIVVLPTKLRPEVQGNTPLILPHRSAPTDQALRIAALVQLADGVDATLT